MLPSLILIGLLVAVGLPLYLLDRRSRAQRGVPDDESEVVQPDEGCSDDCCATNAVCPSEKLLQATMEPATYFDDEELDDFRGRNADGYTPDEEEQWRDVLYTLRHDELLSWERSIKKRGIVMPSTIHDELIMLHNEPQPTKNTEQSN